MEKQLLQVRRFEEIIKADLPDKPTMWDGDKKDLRQRLLEEEVKEMAEATTIEEFSDGMCDTLYILFGTAHEYGIADRLALMFDEVHRSNMSKFPNGEVLLREDGKVLKPDSFSPPNLRSILNRRYHLFNNDNATFADDLQAINKAEHKRWTDHVEAEIMKRLKWHHRIMAKFSSWLESIIKRKVDVKMDVDDAYRNRVTINAYGKETELIDY